MSAPYRLAKKRGMEPVNEIAKAIVAAAPDRAIWGSDWPHIPWGELDTGILLNLLPTWAPDPADMKKILSDNPKKLMGFRSEEHTSELQSLMRISYAVFCLKKKKKKNTQ